MTINVSPARVLGEYVPETTKRSMTITKFIAWVFFLCSAMCVFTPSVMAATIEAIKIDGAGRIESQTVLSYLEIKVGDKLSQETLDQGVKNLFATGLFADISMERDGHALIVNVVENPIINQIAFEGNDKIDDEELRAEIQLRERQVFTRTKVQADVTRLYQIYRRNGRFSADINPKIIKLDQNRVNLIFEIEEGDITKIKSIRFVGNKRFDDDALRSVITTKETAWYRFITADDRYDPDRLNFDEELLRRHYLEQGYADFRVNSAMAELAQNKEGFFVTFTLEEGQRYKYGKIELDSKIKDLNAHILEEMIEIQPGDWYDSNLVEETVAKLTDRLGDLQYAFVSIRPDIRRDREALIIDLTLRINETPRVFVERINITGNSRTLDKVIRREMEVAEGDPFNRTKIAESEQNIRDLNFFENVEMRATRGSSPDKSLINVSVEEKSTGELSIGAGFSTQDGPLADFRIRERNLLGKAQDLSFGATVAGERTEFDISFTEPYFLDRDISTGFDLFHVVRDLQDESSFDQRRTGGALRLGYPLSQRWRQTWRYRAERNEITDVEDSASRFIRDQEGTRDTSAISQRIAYDSRDSRLFPTDGWYIWLDTEVTGLGGDSAYYSGKTGASYFYPIYDGVVMNVLGEIAAIEGYGDEEVAINERYYLGGSTLRGFEQSGVGPRDIVTADSLGGNRFYRGTVEFSFPVGLPEELGVKGHTFSDFGSLFDLDESESDPNVEDVDNIRASAGIGLSWRSPFGPIRVDLAHPFASENFDQEETFRFNFGTRF